MPDADTPFAIRTATPADAAKIKALYIESFTATFGHRYPLSDLHYFLSKADFAAALQHPGNLAFVGAQEGPQAGAIGGFVLLGAGPLPIADQRPRWLLRQLYLRHQLRGSGLAQCLLDCAVAASRARHKSELLLTVLQDNHRARRFYARNGFVEIGTRRFPVGHSTDDHFILRLALG